MLIFKVLPCQTGRLDAFLLSQLSCLTPGKLHQYLRENKLKLNGKKQPLSTRVCAGDEIRLYLPPSAEAAPVGPAFLRARAEFCAVYEDEAVLVAEKPAGLPVEDKETPGADTLINRALRYLMEAGRYDPRAAFAPSLCHRLDTGTSGLVLIAKTEPALEQLTALIRAHRLKKSYVGVSFGHPQPAAGVLRGYLSKDAQRGRVRVFSTPEKNALPIETRYKTLITQGPLALLELELITGRTHQIRAHLASIGCPLLGDSKYGNNSANRAYRLKYQALCAYALVFPALDGPCAGLSQKRLQAAAPWYYTQMLQGGLAQKESTSLK